ncbi:MAG: NHL repeat-containing protein [Armatimonadota bacterium]
MRNFLKAVVLNAIILMLIAMFVTGCSKSNKTSSKTSSTSNSTKNFTVSTESAPNEPAVETAVQPKETATDENDKPIFTEIAVGKDGSIFAICGGGIMAEDPRIWKFNPGGGIAKVWKLQGDKVKSASSIAVGPDGNVYASEDWMSGKVQKFDSSGKHLGTQDVDHASMLAIGGNGSIFVSSEFGDLSMIDPSGWGMQEIKINKSDAHIDHIAADKNGVLYAMGDTGSYSYSSGKYGGNWKVRILKISPEGKVVTDLNTTHKSHPQLTPIDSFTVTGDGHIFAINNFDCSVKEYNLSGKLLGKWGKEGENQGEIYDPTCIATDSKDNIYIGDELGRIQKFTRSGKFVKQY